MNTLQAIQTISKIGKIISKIAYIVCIVAFCLCIVGIATLAAGLPALKLGGVTIQSILQDNADLSTGTMYAAMTAGAIVCAGEAVLAKLAGRYFGKELSDGTPFTMDGAKELQRLGILSIAIPLIIRGASAVAVKIIVKVFAETAPPDFDPAVSLTVGALVLVLALVCRYGAELSAAKPADGDGTAPQQ